MREIMHAGSLGYVVMVGANGQWLIDDTEPAATVDDAIDMLNSYRNLDLGATHLRLAMLVPLDDDGSVTK